MKTNMFFRILTVLVLATIVLSACGSPASSVPGASGVPAPVAKDLVSILNKGRKYYNDGVDMEGKVTKLRRAYETARSNIDVTVSDLVVNNAICFKNVASTEVAIGQAVMDQSQNSQSLINALVTQSVSGEQATTECTKLNQQIADFVISNRQAVLDAYNQFFQAATDYKLYTSDFPEIKIMNDLLQTYADPTQVANFLQQNNLPGFTDFTWLPTENLYMDFPGNKAKCDYYTTGAFMNDLPALMKMKFEGHEQSLLNLYEARWMPTSGAKGNCRLLRQAALDEMTVSILSAGTQNVINTGTDTGSIPTPQP